MKKSLVSIAILVAALGFAGAASADDSVMRGQAGPYYSPTKAKWYESEREQKTLTARIDTAPQNSTTSIARSRGSHKQQFTQQRCMKPPKNGQFAFGTYLAGANPKNYCIDKINFGVA